MDSALLLKQRFDADEKIAEKEIDDLFHRSELIQVLLSDIDEDVLNLLNRLTQLSEIPYTYRIKKVKGWMDTLVDKAWFGEGFSFSGKKDDLLACYHSMITSLLIRMHYPKQELIDGGIEWILKYQNVERGKDKLWPGTRMLKYGGCMKSTPCYIGVVKAMIALSDYKHSYGSSARLSVDNKLEAGLEYILAHRVYKRLNHDQSITKDIVKLTYPFSYKTNVLEILRLLKANGKDHDERCRDAREFLLHKRHKEGYWKVNSAYLPKGWISFDKTREPGLWITHEIKKIL